MRINAAAVMSKWRPLSAAMTSAPASNYDVTEKENSGAKRLPEYGLLPIFIGNNATADWFTD